MITVLGLDLLAPSAHADIFWALLGAPLAFVAVHYFNVGFNDALFIHMTKQNAGALMFYQEWIYNTLRWLVAFTAGYLQWFVVLPWCFRKGKGMFRSAGNAESH